MDAMSGRGGRSGRSGLRNRGRGGLGQTGQIGADEADWGGWGRLAAGRTRADGADLRTGRTRRTGRREGIPGVLSPDADYGVIWLHTPRIHIRFFGAHVVVLFLGTHTSKAQKASTSDKFFGLLGALNITYSMLIQMGHAIRDVVIVTHKGGSSSLVPLSPLCTSCCL